MVKGQTGLPGAAMSTSADAEVVGAGDDESPFRWFTVAPIDVVAVSQ